VHRSVVGDGDLRIERLALVHGGREHEQRVRAGGRGVGGQARGLGGVRAREPGDDRRATARLLGDHLEDAHAFLSG
jgi:hypothetical protein